MVVAAVHLEHLDAAAPSLRPARQIRAARRAYLVQPELPVWRATARLLAAKRGIRGDRQEPLAVQAEAAAR